MKLGMEVGLGPGHTVLDGDPTPPRKRAQPPFSAHVYCSQTVGMINMPLGTEVGLGPGDIVLDGDSTPPSPRNTGTARASHFRPMSISIVTKRSPISVTAELLLFILR